MGHDFNGLGFKSHLIIRRSQGQRYKFEHDPANLAKWVFVFLFLCQSYFIYFLLSHWNIFFL